jgi:hypothetical protein
MPGDVKEDDYVALIAKVEGKLEDNHYTYAEHTGRYFVGEDALNCVFWRT